MKQNKPQSQMGRIFAGGMMITIGIGVMMLLGKHSLNFFTWTFSGQDEVYAWLGLLLTSIGAVGWLLDFLYMADTPLRNVIALTMTAISLLGELGAAGFDMYRTAIMTIGQALTENDIKMMTIIVAGLGFIHGVAMVIYIAGDYIGEAWKQIKPEDEPIPAPALFQPSEGKKYEATVAVPDSQWDDLVNSVVKVPSPIEKPSYTPPTGRFDFPPHNEKDEALAPKNPFPESTSEPGN